MTLSHPSPRPAFAFIGRFAALLLALGTSLQSALAQDLARNRPTLASTNENATLVPSLAVDGNAATRWSSAFADPQWIRVDLGSVQNVNRVVLNWEAASARDYQVQVSSDGSAWTTIATRVGMPAGARRDDLTGLTGSGRYVRMSGTARTTPYGYSLFDFEVYGGGPLPTLPGRIQAEDFKAGGEGVGYHDITAGNTGGAYRATDVDIQATTDAGGGFNVGWTDAGEWLAYDVSVPEAGVYDFKLRVASGQAGTKILRLDVDGIQAGSFSYTSSAGWQSWVDVSLNGVSLSAGNHALRLYMMTAGINLNWIEATRAAGGPGQLAFSASAYSVLENSGTATLTVSRTGGSAGSVGVTYATSNGSATAGSDYTARTGTLTFAAGVTTQTFSIPIVDDMTAEPGETVNLTLSSPTGGATLGTPATAVLTLVDNDEARPALPGRLQAEDFKAGAAGIAYHDLTAGNTGGAYRTTDVDIEATTDAGGGFNVGWTDAGEWLAYDVNVTQAGVYDFKLRVASGVAGTKTLRLDVDGGLAGTFNYTSSAGWQAWSDVVLSGVSLTAGQHTLRITMVTAGINLNWIEATAGGGLPGRLALSAATYSVGEAGGSLTVTVNRTDGAAGTVGVSYATSNGTATAGSDYTARTGALSFGPGVTSQTFTVPVLDDAAVEPAETFNITLSAPTGGASLGTPATAVATITDNDESRPALPGRLQAEDFKAGGEGVGYHDLTAGNLGGAYKATDVDIEATTDGGQGFNVGWIDAGEWLAFDVNVAQAGTFDFTARVASDVAGTKTLRYEVDGASVGSVSFTAAGGWQAWSDAVLRGVTLTAGNHTLRIVFVTANFNLNYVDVVRGVANVPPVAAAGVDQAALVSRPVALDGRASRDPDAGPSALSLAWTQVSGPTASLTGAATATPTFTPSAAGNYVFRLTAADGAATVTDDVAVTVVADPGLPGPRTSTRVVYAAPDLDYAQLATPPIIFNGVPVQGDFRDYHLLPASSPYATRTVDLSVFDCGGNTFFPPIASDATNLPVNGVFHLPSGTGPFPIAFFVHGNHAPVERSETGYEEAAAFLASHGIIAVSIDQNYINASGGNGARAVLLLEHVKQFRTWNQAAGHPLQGRVDMDRVMLIGHSRGGEAVEHASVFNRQTLDGRTSIRPFPNTAEFDGFNAPVTVDGSGQFGPWRFNLQAVVAVAPTEAQYMPVDPADETRRVASVVRESFHLLYGSRDSDVFSFVGYAAYDRAVPFPATTAADNVAAPKSLLYLFNANHNYFNRVWAANPDGTGRCRFGVCYNPSFQLHKDDQYAAFKTWLATVSLATVLGQAPYLEVLGSKPLLASALPRTARTDAGDALALGFNSQYQGRHRRMVNHYEEDAVLATPSPLPAGITGTNEVLGGIAATEAALTSATNAQWFTGETRGLNVQWNASGTNSYRTVFNDGPPLTSPGGTLTHLAFRVGFTRTETLNPANTAQDLTVMVRDFAGNSHAMTGADLLGAAPMPWQSFYTDLEDDFKAYTAVKQTLRFPLAAFAQRGVAVDDIAEIRLRFDRTPAGSLYIDDIQLTR